MATFERQFVAVNRALVALVLAAVFVIVFINVIGRYFFGESLAWGEEAARHLMVFGAFCGAGLALREGRLVSIDLFQNMLPAAMAVYVRWFGVLAMGVFMAALLWLGASFVSFSWNNQTMSTGMSRGIPYLSIPIGCGLFLCHLALFAGRFVRRDFEQFEEPQEDDGLV